MSSKGLYIVLSSKILWISQSTFNLLSVYYQTVVSNPSISHYNYTQSENPHGTMASLVGALLATEEVQKEILGHLNIHDAINMRQTSRNMDYVLRGRPSTTPSGNTTKSLLHACCDERRRLPLPGPPDNPWIEVACSNGPLADVRMQYCEIAQHHMQADGGPQNVCANCRTHNQAYSHDSEEFDFNRQLVNLCGTCQAEEERTYPDGYSTCTCRYKVRGRWMCVFCQTLIMEIFTHVSTVRRKDLVHTRRNPLGRVIVDPRHYNQQACRCGRDRHPHQQSVRMCLGCDGVVVEPTNPGLRRSMRIRERNSRRLREHRQRESRRRLAQG